MPSAGCTTNARLEIGARLYLTYTTILSDACSEVLYANYEFISMFLSSGVFIFCICRISVFRWHTDMLTPPDRRRIFVAYEPTLLHHMELVKHATNPTVNVWYKVRSWLCAFTRLRHRTDGQV